MLKKCALIFTLLMLVLCPRAHMTSLVPDPPLPQKILNVSVILDTPAGSFAEPEKIYQTVDESLKRLFDGDPKYKVQPLGDTDAYIQLYREEHNDANTTDYGNISNTGMRDLTLKRSDIEELSKHFNADYMIYIRVTSSMPKYTDGFFSAGQKVNVVLDFRIFSAQKNDFVYLKRSMTTGSSNSIYIGYGSANHAIDRGLRKGLKEIENYSADIRALMD